MTGSSGVPVFLDRDGTLIVEKHYLSDPEEVSLEGAVVDGLSQLQEDGHPLIVVSNQSGVGRGLFSEADAHAVNGRVDALLRQQGIVILAWYLCPHAPETPCTCRKPLPGLPIAAAREWGLRLPGSYVIGDKRSDLELADAIDGTGILLTTGHGRVDSAWAKSGGRPVFDSLKLAADYVREHARREG
jgi:histidinol-phosphate phosphatase family protein